MEHSQRRPALSRPIVAFAIGSLLLVAAIRLLELTPPPYGPVAAAFLHTVGPISLAVDVFLAAVLFATVAVLRSRPRDVVPDAQEEPWLAEPRLPRTRARCPLIGFIGLEPGAGSSTIAFNLGVLLATEGTRRSSGDHPRRPRPLCLLAEGSLTEALGLSPYALREHVATFPGRITQDVIDLASRHPSGCEFICVQRGVLGRHQLRLFRDAVEQYYDALIVDCSSADSWLREAVEDVSDVIVLIALPSGASTDAGASAAERAVAGHRLAISALLANRLTAGRRMPEGLGAIFENHAEIPEEAAVASMDRAGLPWCLAPLSQAGRQLRLFASGLLPEIFVADRNVA
jgi:hypothetical protein